MVDREAIMAALKECYDPEIPLNIVDLGLVYDVAITGDDVHVKMTLTAPGCPMHTMISQDVASKLRAVPGVKQAEVEIVWDPPWDPSRLSPEGKRRLGFPA